MNSAHPVPLTPQEKARRALALADAIKPRVPQASPLNASAANGGEIEAAPIAAPINGGHVGAMRPAPAGLEPCPVEISGAAVDDEADPPTVTAAQKAAYVCVAALEKVTHDDERRLETFRQICRTIAGAVANGDLDRQWADDLLTERADLCGVADECSPENVSAIIAAAFNAATVSEKEADGPLPLVPVLAPSSLYPVEALGAILGPAASAIANKIQLPVSIAAQSVLAAAALAAQAHADVKLAFGQTRPLSLFFLSVASSGDRKTTADGEALGSVRHYERALAENYGCEFQDWQNQKAAWDAERSKVESDKKLTFSDRVAKLEKTGPAPARPLHPMLTAPEPTIEGLIKFAVDAPPALGLFSAEGGQFVGGHGLTPDNKLKTAAALSELWDGRPVRRIRAADGVTVLQGRRLSLHMMLQPVAAFDFCADATLRDQGLLSRLLIAAPASMAGSRLFRTPTFADNEAIHKYDERITALLKRPWPIKEGTRNELAPKVLRMSDDASECWRQFHDHIEGQLGPAGDLRPIGDFAAKAAEHAARVAGVLAIVENPDAAEITAACMGRAITLADWYVQEALRLAAYSMTAPAVRAAARLLDWLKGRTGDPITVREIVRKAPPEFRTKQAATRAIELLVSHGWLVLKQKPDGARGERWELKGAAE